jgi:hypothetical protein
MMCAYPFSSHFCVTKSTKSFPGAEKGNTQLSGAVNLNDLTLAWSSRNCTDTLYRQVQLATHGALATGRGGGWDVPAPRAVP